MCLLCTSVSRGWRVQTDGSQTQQGDDSGKHLQAALFAVLFDEQNVACARDAPVSEAESVDGSADQGSCQRNMATKQEAAGILEAVNACGALLEVSYGCMPSR